jgi:hypothetical protein
MSRSSGGPPLAPPPGRPRFGDISLPQVPEHEEELEPPFFPHFFLLGLLDLALGRRRSMFSRRRRVRPQRLTLFGALGAVLYLAIILYVLGGLVFAVLVFGRWEWLWFLRLK